jgi:WD40 repeat protein
MTERSDQRARKRAACLISAIGLLITLTFLFNPFNLPQSESLLRVRAEGTPTPAPIITSETFDRVVALRSYGRGSVNAMSYAPDGKTLAVLSASGIWLYDVDTFQTSRLIAWRDPNGAFRRLVAWAPDSRFIITSAPNNALQIWSVEAGAPVRTLEGHAASVLAVTWSPDGRYIAASSDDSTVRIWEAESGRRIRTMVDRSPARALAWSPDSRLVAAGSEHVRLWEAETGVSVRLFTVISRSVRAVAWSPDGQYIAASEGRYIGMWKAQTGEFVGEFRQRADSLAWTPDGSQILIADDNVYGYRLNISTGEITIHTAGERIAWAPNGERVAVLNGDTLNIIDIERDETLYSTDEHLGWLYDVAWSPNGQLVAFGTGSALYTWDMRTPPQRFALPNGAGYSVETVAWSPDGRLVLSTGRGIGQRLRVWDAQSGTLLWEWSEGGLGAWSPNQSIIAVGGWLADWAVSLLNAQTGEVLRQMGTDGRTHAIAWSPDGRYLLTGGSTLEIWDTHTGERLKTLTDHTGQVISVAWSPEESVFASSGDDRTLRLWDATTYMPIAVSQMDFMISELAWSPNGRYLLSGEADSRLCLFNGQTGALLRCWESENGAHGVAWSPDGRYIISGGARGVVTVWGVR